MTRSGKPNRNKSKAPKKGIFWCWGCDAQLVAEVEKCPFCGKRNQSSKKRRFDKRDLPPIEDDSYEDS